MTPQEFRLVATWAAGMWPARTWEESTVVVYADELSDLDLGDVFEGCRRIGRETQSPYPPDFASIRKAADRERYRRQAAAEDEAIEAALAAGEPPDISAVSAGPAPAPQRLRRILETLAERLTADRQGSRGTLARLAAEVGVNPKDLAGLGGPR
jgi:hypothetical protein